MKLEPSNGLWVSQNVRQKLRAKFVRLFDPQEDRSSAANQSLFCLAYIPDMPRSLNAPSCEQYVSDVKRMPGE
jgi:hypothetical protein